MDRLFGLTITSPNESFVRAHLTVKEFYIMATKTIRSTREKRAACESKGVLQVRLYHKAICDKVISKSSVVIYQKQPVSGMVTSRLECVLTKEAVEFLKSDALQNDLHALITVFDHKAEAVKALDGKSNSAHYSAAIKAVLSSAAEDLKDKPELAQDRLIAYTAACRKTVGKFLSNCAAVVNGDCYQRAPLTGTCSKSGKPLTAAWVVFGTSSDCLDMLDSTEIKTSVLIGQKSTGCDETTSAEIEVADPETKPEAKPKPKRGSRKTSGKKK